MSPRRGFVVLRYHANPVVSDLQLNFVLDSPDGERDQPDAVRESVFDRIGSQFINQQSKRHDALGIDMKVFCLDGYLNVGAAAQQAG
jgi:hypothetical protein